MALTPIAKLEKFTGKEDNAQTWINDVTKAITANNWDDARTMQVISYFLKNTVNSWYYSLAQKPQNFNAFKIEFLRYFSDNNSINCLASTFTTLKQEDTETVTTYLECFHRNLRQIQAIQADYFTAPQILNQFIRVHPIHLVDLSTVVTYARNFEAAELKANHAQTVNLVMNGSSNLNSKLKQFSDSINQKLERYLADNHPIYQPPQQFAFIIINKSAVTLEPIAMLIVIHDRKINIGIPITKDAAFSKQKTNQKPLTYNIPPTASTKDESLAAIFPFELEEITLVLLFSRAALDTKPITMMYTDAKVDGQYIKLILDSRSAGSIITKQLMDQLSHQVD
ncbi:hypothetical protein G9A89_018609 [Geosiphon pyriformis]|nr:hypothetical protein G9A89_018609 [Geosiphon pyriformis]